MPCAFYFTSLTKLPTDESTLSKEQDNPEASETLLAAFHTLNQAGKAEAIKDKVFENIRETSKIYDVFKIASYDYGFLARTIIKKHTDIVEEDIDKMLKMV